MLSCQPYPQRPIMKPTSTPCEQQEIREQQDLCEQQQLCEQQLCEQQDP
jgi:hypothetical protein